MTERAETQDQTTSLESYLTPLREYRNVVALVTLVTLAIGFLFAVAGPKNYTATTSVLIYPVSADPTEALQSTDRSEDMATELRIAQSRAVAEVTATELAALGIDVSPQSVEADITVSNPEDSRVLSVSYRSSDPAVARVGSELVTSTYLAYRSELNAASRQVARTAINDDIAVLQDRLAEVTGRVDTAVVGSSARLVAEVEQTSIEGELKAQQGALADLSTLSIDAATIFDTAREPAAADGLGAIQLLIGSVAGGLVLGIIAAWTLAALGIEINTERPARPERPERPRRQLRRSNRDAEADDSDDPFDDSDNRDPLELLRALDAIEADPRIAIAASKTKKEAERAAEADGAVVPEAPSPSFAEMYPVTYSGADSNADGIIDGPDESVDHSESVDHNESVDHEDPVDRQELDVQFHASTESETVAEPETVAESETVSEVEIVNEVDADLEPEIVAEIDASTSSDDDAGLDAVAGQASDHQDGTTDDQDIEDGGAESSIEVGATVEPPAALRGLASLDARLELDRLSELDAPSVEGEANTTKSDLFADLTTTVELPADYATIDENDVDVAPEVEQFEDFQSSPFDVASDDPFAGAAVDRVDEADQDLGQDETTVESSVDASQETTVEASEDASQQTTVESSDDAGLNSGDPNDLDPGPPSWDGPFVGPTTWDQLTAMAEAVNGPAQAADPSTPTLGAEPEPTSVASTDLVAGNDVDALFERLRQLGSAGPVAVLSLSDRHPAAGLTAGFELADELRAVGANVLLIDARLETPVLDTLFEDGPGAGVAQVMTGEVVLDQAIRTLDGLDGLDLLTVGTVGAETNQHLTGAPFARLLSEARLNYHSIVVIGDAITAAGPADVVGVERARAMAAMVDGLIVGTAAPAGTAASADLIAVLGSFEAPTLQLITAPVAASESAGSAGSVASEASSV